MQIELVEFVRNRQRQPVGVVVASLAPSNNGNKYFDVGWSRCKRGDTFDRYDGLRIARNRILTGNQDPIPHSLVDACLRMEDRAVRYFKDATSAKNRRQNSI